MIIPGHSWFEVSTTVVNPSLWMPMYEESRSNAIFFVFFIIISVFYLHSLVLSVVFQTYIQAAGEIHDRCASDREDAIRLAFLALVRDDQSEYISAASVRKTLQVVRPHYSTMKVSATHAAQHFENLLELTSLGTDKSVDGYRGSYNPAHHRLSHVPYENTASTERVHSNRPQYIKLRNGN
jgi:hypothetical protein